MVKFRLQPPVELALAVPICTPSREMVMPVSLASKAVPLTVTELPTGPLVRLREMLVEALMVKSTPSTSPSLVSSPEAVIV